MLLPLCALCLLAAAEPQPLTLTPAATERVLLNPGMGLYAQCGGGKSLAPPDAWWLPVIDIGYFRMDWADVQPNGPDDDPLTYFGPLFDQWVGQLGKRVAIRVMSESMHSRREYVTPKWVFDHGVPGVDHVGLFAKHQVDPVFWDDRYLDAACAFIARLGRALDGRPGLEFIDIGQIGEWGEMHLGEHTSGRWNPLQREQTGYTREKYVAAYRRVIDAFHDAFPHTRVFLNVGDYGQINDYSALRGQHFRQDGLNPGGPSANVGERFYKPYADRGVLGNYEFFSSYAEMQQKGWDLRKTLDVGLSVPLSYLNTNLYGVNGLLKAPPEVRDLLTDAARRIGYRFGVSAVRTFAPFRATGVRAARVPVTLVWRNRGIAWCPESCAVEVGLFAGDAAEPLCRSYCYPQTPTTRWAPGAEVEVPLVLTVPKEVGPGTYRLAVRMFVPERPTQRALMLDLPTRAGGWHDLGETTAVAAQPAEAVMYRETFAGPTPHRWQPSKGVAGTVVEDAAVGHALRLAGTNADAWSLGSVRVPLTPGARCRLSCRLKVDSYTPRNARVTVKLGCNRQDGGWIANFNSNAYELAVGGWQRLAVTFDLPPDATQGDIALEKGGRNAVTADVSLADVSLELLEGA